MPDLQRYIDAANAKKVSNPNSLENRLAQAHQQTQQLQQNAQPGTTYFDPTKYEMAAGVAPQTYEGTRDAHGQLLDQYKLNPYAGQAQQALQQQAFSQGSSPWAQMQLQQQQMGQQNALMDAQKQAQQSAGMAQAGLARNGGLPGGGAAALMARSNARDMLSAGQDVSRQGMQQRLDIGAQDIQRKNDLLGNFAAAEGQAQQGNIGTMTGDIANRAGFNANRYNSAMGAWGAGQTAKAQAAAGKMDKK